MDRRDGRSRKRRTRSKRATGPKPRGRRARLRRTAPGRTIMPSAWRRENSMQSYEKVIKLVVRTVVGRFDEDGELIGERVLEGPEEAKMVYHPFEFHPLLNSIERSLKADQERLPR